jgi:hypothetical protein
VRRLRYASASAIGGVGLSCCALLVVAGCDDHHTRPAAVGRFDSATALQGALHDGGVDCQTAQRKDFPEQHLDTITCTSVGPGSDGTSYGLVTWTGSPRASALAALTQSDYVEGPNWRVIVSSGNRSQAERVRAAIGGEYHGDPQP